MRKFYLAIVALAIASVIFMSCKKSHNPEDCSKLADKVKTNGITYDLHPTSANFKAYTEVINEWLDCTGVTGQDRQNWVELLSELDCY